MSNIDKRLTQLEGEKLNADLDRMTVEQLDSHLIELKAGSPEWFRVLLAGIWRRGSRLPLKQYGRRG